MIYTCVSVLRNGKKIKGYNLSNADGQTVYFETDKLKEKLSNSEIFVANLKLTKDNRIIESDSETKNILKELTKSTFEYLGFSYGHKNGISNIRKLLGYNTYVIFDFENGLVIKIPELSIEMLLYKSLNGKEVSLRDQIIRAKRIIDLLSEDKEYYSSNIENFVKVIYFIEILRENPDNDHLVEVLNRYSSYLGITDMVNDWLINNFNIPLNS